MSFQIADNYCEICIDINKKDKTKPIKPASVAMSDKNNQLRYSCFEHVLNLWNKLGKP